MATQTIPIGRTTDRTVLEFFEIVQRDFQFDQISLWVIGADNPINFTGTDAETVKSSAKYSLRQVTATKNQSSINYYRNRTPDRITTPDSIEINNANNMFTPTAAIKLNELVADKFTGIAGNLEFLGNPEAFATVIRSHQEIISRLELSLERVSEKFSTERLNLQTEQEKFVREKQQHYEGLENGLKALFSEKEIALTEREKRLDDRDNMHVRRGIRADLKKRLQEHATDFTLTKRTKQLRIPIHVTVWAALVALAIAITFYSLHLRLSQGIDYPTLAKSALLTIAAFGILAWYMRWMNDWFAQHADAEFNLKQFELDIDRASWVVETAMEWRSSQHGIMPISLLESISRNLFASKRGERDEEIHPADYVASALLGNASRAKLKLGDAELEYSRSGLKKASEIPSAS